MAEEKTFSVGVQTSSPTRINVTSNVSENPITASADTGLYYSQLAKNWAIGEGLIQNEDYSSKTWAGESKASADLSKMYSEAASLDLENLENKISIYDEQLNTTLAEGLDSISSAVTSGIGEIDTSKLNVLAQIEEVVNASIEDINATGIDTKVSKSGDTMTGDLTIEGNYTPRYYLKNTSLDLDNLTTPSSNTVLGGINIVDNDEDYIAYLQSTLANTGLLYTSFGTRRKINGQDVTASLSTSIAEDGTAYANAPTYTTYTDSSGKIVTTAFLKNVLAGNGYGLMNFTKAYGAGGFKLANGIIVNWGSFEPTSNGQEVTINFKYPFSSAYYHIVYSRNTGTTTTSTVYLPWTRQRATTSAKVYAPSISGYTWVAFGY